MSKFIDLNKQFDARKTSDQYFRDLGGDHVARYAGHCWNCKRRVYAEYDIEQDQEVAGYGEPDGRGIIDTYHALRTVRAEYFGKVGDNVIAWDDCMNTSESYKRIIEYAFSTWQDSTK